MHRSQSAKIQRSKSRKGTPKKSKKVIKKPAWDDSIHDLSQYRLSKEELSRKKLMSISKNNKEKQIKNPKHHTISGINISKDSSSSMIMSDVSALSLHEVDFDEEMREYEENKKKHAIRQNINNKLQNSNKIEENNPSKPSVINTTTKAALVSLSPAKINNENKEKEEKEIMEKNENDSMEESSSFSLPKQVTTTVNTVNTANTANTANTRNTESSVLSKSIPKNKYPLIEKEVLKYEELKEIKNELVDYNEVELSSILLEKEIQKISTLFNGNDNSNNDISLPCKNSTELIQRLMNNCLYLSDYVLKIKEELEEEKMKNNELKNELEGCIKDNIKINNEWKEYKRNIDEKLEKLSFNNNNNIIEEIKTYKISPGYNNNNNNNFSTSNISSVSNSSPSYIENISVSNEYNSPPINNISSSSFSPPKFTPPTSLLLPKKYDLLDLDKHIHHNNEKYENNVRDDNSSVILLGSNEKRMRFKDPIESYSPNVSKNLINSFNENDENEYDNNISCRSEIQKEMIMREKCIDLNDDKFEPCFLE